MHIPEAEITDVKFPIPTQNTYVIIAIYGCYSYRFLSRRQILINYVNIWDDRLHNEVQRAAK